MVDCKGFSFCNVADFLFALHSIEITGFVVLRGGTSMRAMHYVLWKYSSQTLKYEEEIITKMLPFKEVCVSQLKWNHIIKKLEIIFNDFTLKRIVSYYPMRK